MKKYLFWAIVVLSVNACSVVDDYMLGKDNTPKPQALGKLNSSIRLKNKWSMTAERTTKVQKDFYKLKPFVTGKYVYAANVSGVLEKRERSDGRLVWSKSFDAGISSGPVVKGDYVSVTDLDASVWVLQASDGEVVWHRQVSNQLLAPPVIAKNELVCKTIDGRLYAFSLTSGRLLWRYNHGAPNLILRASSAPLVVGNIVVAGFGDGKLDALDLKSGRTLWKRRVGYANGSSDVERMIDIDATPIVSDNVLYTVSFQGFVSAITLSNGHVLWQHKLSSYKDMALGGRYLYVTDAKSHVWAFNKHNGSVAWRQKELMYRGLSAPVLSQYGVLVTDKLGYLHVLSKRDGHLLGRLQIAKEEIDASPVVAGNHVYVITDKGVLNDVEIGKV